mgnify:CR=1 FL=1
MLQINQACTALLKIHPKAYLQLLQVPILSYQANSACKEAIEQTISAHYAENRLDTEAAVKDVLEKFGTER